MDFEKLLETSEREMDEAEDKLCADLGFPVEQWMLIKDYFHAATLANMARCGKAAVANAAAPNALDDFARAAKEAGEHAQEFFEVLN